ncbi:kinesin-like protein KIF15-like [Achlya hypogyna]|uniref:Kinesin-like protein KIF15-like n=1 Tax=Achlya hypogyna TaxID=1202772 RepID=A0A1V9Z1Q5_ACHHY|nr:kinesin-like protein KIF15-like [Achlya hypogyna]
MTFVGESFAPLTATQRVHRMVTDPHARKWAAACGLAIQEVCWEDNARMPHSSWGPCISDMTLVVNNAHEILSVPTSSIIVTVGNESPDPRSPLQKIGLDAYLKEIYKYSELTAGLFVEGKDDQVLVSPQSCFLPLEGDGTTGFHVELFDYQSQDDAPAILVLLCTDTGTSAQVLGTHRTRLFCNHNGTKHVFEAERLSTDRQKRGVPLTGCMTEEEEARNFVMIVQIPLKQRRSALETSISKCSPTSRFYLTGTDCIKRNQGLYAPTLPTYTPTSPAYAPSVPAYDPTAPAYKAAMVRLGAPLGLFPSLSQLRGLERDEQFPIRVTVQYYQATSNGVASPLILLQLADKMDRLRAHATWAAVGNRASLDLRKRKVHRCPFEAGRVEKDNIRTFVRLRPLPAALKSAPNIFTHDAGSLTLETGAKDKRFFVLDGVLDATASQEAVFTAVGHAVVDNVLAGYHSSVLAYGQTGSGKTYTMQGHLHPQSPDRGIIARILERLFADLHGMDFVCTCSYVEIYGEKIYDLLDGKRVEAKCVREDSVDGVFVQNLVERPLRSVTEAFAQLVLGSKHRSVASTSMNRESSRSHAVFTLKLLQRIAVGSAEVTDLVRRKSVLHCVDLAGSEKQSLLGVAVKEATMINKSLSCLAKVIAALVDASAGAKRHVPYRDSKLTFLLRDSLGGNSKTTIVATVSSEARWAGETLSTLQFVERAKCIRTIAYKNDDSQEVIAQLQAQIVTLQAALASQLPPPPPNVVTTDSSTETDVSPTDRALASAVVVCVCMAALWRLVRHLKSS